jgi:hypothetical protein
MLMSDEDCGKAVESFENRSEVLAVLNAQQDEWKTVCSPLPSTVWCLADSVRPTGLAIQVVQCFAPRGVVSHGMHVCSICCSIHAATGIKGLLILLSFHAQCRFKCEFFECEAKSFSTFMQHASI